MSRFFSNKYANLEAYTPGEQPVDKKYIKLNTNESPYPPSENVLKAAELEAGKLNLYSDPESSLLTQKVAAHYGVDFENVLMTNGSDEILDFAFMAFCDEAHPIVFPDITYGFYPVFAQRNHIPFEEIPLEEDFSIDSKKYCGIHKNIVIANPNAPTGILMSLSEIEEIVKSNPDNVVIIDEAYIDFSSDHPTQNSAVNLIGKYENLLVTMTFSKSRSLAGARLGFGIADKKLIHDLKTLKYSTNPYNVNRMTGAAGMAAIDNNAYYADNCKRIIEIRAYVKEKLEALGFTVLPSAANFLFIKSDKISGEELYLRLKENGILIRHFSKERIREYNRVTIGTRDEMEAFLAAVSSLIC